MDSSAFGFLSRKFVLSVLAVTILFGVFIGMIIAWSLGGESDKDILPMDKYDLQAVYAIGKNKQVLKVWEGVEVYEVAFGYSNDGLYNFNFPDSIKEKMELIFIRVYNRDEDVVEFKDLIPIERVRKK